MTYLSNIEIVCGKPTDGEPQFCEPCPIKYLKPRKFLGVIQGLESLSYMVNDDLTQLSGPNREVARRIVQEDGEFNDKGTAELAIVALERQLDGRCDRSKGD